VRIGLFVHLSIIIIALHYVLKLQSFEHLNINLLRYILPDKMRTDIYMRFMEERGDTLQHLECKTGTPKN